MARPVALVTGAASGIGLATALRLATDFDLSLVDPDSQRLEAVRSKFSNDRCLAFCMARPVALVTGAASGIGLATALRLATDFDLSLVDPDSQRLEAVRSKFSNDRCLAFCADISSDEEIGAARAALLVRFGRLDAIVANAGLNGSGLRLTI